MQRVLNDLRANGEVKRRFKHALRRQIVMIQTHLPLVVVLVLEPPSIWPGGDFAALVCGL